MHYSKNAGCYFRRNTVKVHLFKSAMFLRFHCVCQWKAKAGLIVSIQGLWVTVGCVSRAQQCFDSVTQTVVLTWFVFKKTQFIYVCQNYCQVSFFPEQKPQMARAGKWIQTMVWRSIISYLTSEIDKWYWLVGDRQRGNETWAQTWISFKGD